MKLFIAVVAILIVVVASADEFEAIRKQVQDISNIEESQRTQEQNDVLVKYFSTDARVVNHKIMQKGVQKKAGAFRKTMPQMKLMGGDIDWNTIVNIGKEIWKIVEDNQAVVTEKYDSGNAVPSGITDWTQLENWSSPDVHTYSVYWKNLYGMKVVDFEFKVEFTWGGDYQGKGKYLTACTIKSSSLSVDWGYTFDAQGTVPSVTNAGSSDDPVAGMTLDLKYSVKTVLKTNNEDFQVYVKGDGTMEEL